MLHPTITKSCLKMFECTLVDSNDKRMTLHMDFKCFSTDHLFWILTVACPLLILWVVGAPLLALVILFKNRKDLDQGYIKSYMLVLYQGLKPKVFYWEFINTLRKVLILVLAVFLSTQSSFYQILCSVLILYLILRIQIRLKPYKYEENNFLEQHATNSGILTILCCIIFTQQDHNYALFITLTLAFLIIINAMFIILWIFYLLLSLNLKNENLKKFLKIYAYIILKSCFLVNYTSQSSEVILKETEKYKSDKNRRNTYQRKSHKLVKKHKHSPIREDQADISKASDYDDTHVIFKIATDKMKKKSNLSNTFKIKHTVDDRQNISSRREMLDMLFEKNEWEEESKYQAPLKLPNDSPNLYST